MNVRARDLRVAVSLICLILFVADAVTAAHVEETTGDKIGEPSINAPSVHVVREALTIDFRPLAAGAERVEVRAQYQLRNDGPAQTSELCSGTPNADVTLGGQPVAAVATQPSCFALALAPGEQTLLLAYRALPDQLPTMLVKSFGLDYGLIAAHGWASLGELVLEVFLPPGWELLDAPQGLEREGESGGYRVRLASVPPQLKHFHDARAGHTDLRPLAASTLRVHAAPAPAPYQTVFVLAQVCCWLAVLLPLAPAWWLWRRARSGQPVPWALRLGSLGLTLFAVYTLPQLPHLMQRRWLPFGASNVFPVAWLLGAWVAGGLLTAVAHMALGWSGRSRAV